MSRHVICLSLILALAGLGCSGDGDGDGGVSSTSPSSPPATSSTSPNDIVTVELLDFEFRPKSITIQPGQTVRWVLRGDDLTHTTTERDGVWDSGMVFTQEGMVFERTFSNEEAGQTFNYSCASHQDCCNMQGSVRVGANAPPPAPGY